MVYVVLCLVSAVIGGVIGQRKGSSYIVWFLISGLIPILGPVAALLYRRETEEALRICPVCGATARLYDAMCMRCGADLEDPDESEIIEPTAALRVRAKL